MVSVKPMQQQQQQRFIVAVEVTLNEQLDIVIRLVVGPTEWLAAEATDKYVTTGLCASVIIVFVVPLAFTCIAMQVFHVCAHATVWSARERVLDGPLPLERHRLG